MKILYTNDNVNIKYFNNEIFKETIFGLDDKNNIIKILLFKITLKL
jgi:hypothetical protein